MIIDMPGIMRRRFYEWAGEYLSATEEKDLADISPHGRLLALYEAHERGINTWVSAEPVLNDDDVLLLIKNAEYVDLWKVGKLNYHHSDIDWEEFGRRAEAALQATGKDYYIKESLRTEMKGEEYGKRGEKD